MDFFNPISGSNNHFTITGSTSGCTTYTVTTPGDCITTLTNFNSMWLPISELDWLPYHYELYKPEWHILQGYESQMEKMWD